VFGEGDRAGEWRSWKVAVPTLVLGTLWARLLRAKRRLGTSNIRAGWLASFPLAAANAGVACALQVSGDPLTPDGALGLFVAGATFGGIVWVPALVMTLLCFGLPIAWAQHASARGLMGEERGELVVGVAVLGVAGLGMVARVDTLTLVLSLAGMALGAMAAGLSLARDLRRERFVAEVAAGHVRGFRVQATAQGRALVRTNPDEGAAYRVASFDEEVIPLDATPLRERAAEQARRC
jgi:hypothetical protein